MGLYGTETTLEPQHDFTKPGMSEETRRLLKQATSDREFAKRVAKANSKFARSVQNRPWRSRAKKWIRYYGQYESPHASFTFYEAFADPAEIAKKMTKLQKLGLSGDQVEVRCCPASFEALAPRSRNRPKCKACKEEARKASEEETT